MRSGSLLEATALAAGTGMVCASGERGERAAGQEEVRGRDAGPAFLLFIG